MTDSIFILEGNEDLIKLEEKEYESETVLQKLLSDNPDLLAGGQIDQESPRRWLFIGREMNIPYEGGGGSPMFVDHLFLDQDAIPTFIEVKRSSSHQIRREVVGQMLDYAANAVKHWPRRFIQDFFTSEMEFIGEDIDITLDEFLQQEMEIADFWEKVEDNLRNGLVRLLFVSDVIPPELQRIVEFLYEQMTPAEVLAIEIKKYEFDEKKIYVPRVIGKTAQTKDPKPRKRRAWDEESFFTKIEEDSGIEAAKTARKIYDWAKPKVSEIWWGKGITMGSFVPTLVHKKTNHQLFAVYTYGSVETYFQYYKVKEPFVDEKKRIDLINKLNSIKGVNLPEESISRRPPVSLSSLDTDEKLKQFFDIYEWFMDEVKAT